jgi:hypothetical protein
MEPRNILAVPESPMKEWRKKRINYLDQSKMEESGQVCSFIPKLSGFFSLWLVLTILLPTSALPPQIRIGNSWKVLGQAFLKTAYNLRDMSMLLYFRKHLSTLEWILKCSNFN